MKAEVEDFVQSALCFHAFCNGRWLGAGAEATGVQENVSYAPWVVITLRPGFGRPQLLSSDEGTFGFPAGAILLTWSTLRKSQGAKACEWGRRKKEPADTSEET